MASVTKFNRLNPVCLQSCIIRFASKATNSNPKKEKAKPKTPSNQSLLYDEMQQHANKVAPKDYKYLSETFIKRLHQVKTKGDHEILKEGKLALWNYIMSYQSQYDEKAILVDSNTASIIAKAILNNSDAQCNSTVNQNRRHSIFIDGNGGLCRVTDEIIRECNETGHIFSCYKIYEKDVNLVTVLQRARNDYLKCNVPDNPGNVMSLMNINQHVVENMRCKVKEEYISELFQRVLVRYPSLPWNTQEPIYTLYLTATLGTIRYMVHQTLTRHSCISNDMSRGRPEFFFVVTPRTLNHLTMGTYHEKTPVKRLTSHRNVLFNLIFEYKVIQEIPRKSFFPWPKAKKKPKIIVSKNIELINSDDNMYLIKARPKTDIGIVNNFNFLDKSTTEDVPGPPSHWLEYFVHAITVESTTKRFLPLLDKWHPSAALNCVRKGLVPVYMTFGDFYDSIEVSEKIIQIFNTLLAQENLPLSTFVAMANEYKQGEMRHELRFDKDYGDEASLEFDMTLKSMTDSDDMEDIC